MNHVIRCLCSGQVATRLSMILIHFKKLGPSPTIKKTINTGQRIFLVGKLSFKRIA